MPCPKGQHVVHHGVQSPHLKHSPITESADQLPWTSPPAGATPAGLGEMGRKRHADGNGPRNRPASVVCGSSDKGGLLRWDRMEVTLQAKRWNCVKTSKQHSMIPILLCTKKYHSALPSYTGQSFPVDKGGIHLWGCDLCQALSMLTWGHDDFAHWELVGCEPCRRMEDITRCNWCQLIIVGKIKWIKWYNTQWNWW